MQEAMDLNFNYHNLGVNITLSLLGEDAFFPFVFCCFQKIGLRLVGLRIRIFRFKLYFARLGAVLRAVLWLKGNRRTVRRNIAF